jgi:hypothetical protein
MKRNNNKNNRNNKRNRRQNRRLTNNEQYTISNDYSTFKLRETNTRQKCYQYNSSASVATGWDVLQITSLVAQGVETHQRIGDRIIQRRLDYRGNILVGDTSNLFRMVLIYVPGDVGNNTPATYFDNGIGGSPTALSFVKLYLRPQRFKVLFDKTWTLSQNSTTQMLHFEFSIPMNCPADFLSPTTTVQTGSIWQFMVSDSAVVPHVGVNYGLRLFYSDL